ncbi:hemicentin-2 isoform X2 [Cavia porcellus]|uniref:hemicentin-2 isoform X2 n=1 Tax=Cavia porcellus TaxID=10141 RepID=UPI002FDFC5F0
MPGAPLLRLLAAAVAVCVSVAGAALHSPKGGATLAFVFDVTGSMWDDLMQVMDGAARILERTLSRSQAVANYALVPFHDPDIGPVTLTADPVVFQKELRDLYVQGGGDCPEMSVGAIKAAVEVANPGSFIYVFSDARAKDHHRKDELLQLLQLKQSQVVFVLTGDCGDRAHPGYLAYEEIASTSSGQVFHLDKQQVAEVLKWVESAVQASKVHLLSTDHEAGGEHTWRLPLDPSLKEVTISLSGPGPEIEVRDPLGRILQKDEGLKVLLSIPDSAKVVAFKPKHPGLWSIKVYSSSRHSVRITGISDIDFRAGFSTQPSLDLNHTIEWPLEGVPISLVINSTGLQAPGSLDSVELSHSSGRPLLTLPMQPLSNWSAPQLWAGPPFHAPRERFYLKVRGKDPEGNALLRVSGVSYSGVTPGAPLVSMAPRIHGHRNQPLLVSCSVHSALPFRLQLYRSGVRLGEERHFLESGNSSWEIPRASKTDEGTYECTAVSKAGTGRARAQVIITDPPPQLVPTPNVTVSPGETAVLSCQVLGDAPYNLTWVRDWRVLPASMGRVTQLANLSLEIRGVVPSDSGRYQCMASNANGATRASTWLLVREVPQVSIDTRAQSFSQGVEVKVSCSASGYPTPHLSWSHEGLPLQEDSRTRVDPQGTLIIQRVAPEDAGNYTCRAANEVGADEETVTLYYADPPLVSAVNSVVLAAVGQEAVLGCMATGAPPPRVVWYRGDLEMILAPEDSSSGVLRVPSAQERDAGVYTCRAINELGTASAEVQLEVGHAPRLTELPRDIAVELGRSAFLACRATGRPPPTVTWHRRDGLPLGLRQRDSGVLLIESVAPEDQATYVCEAQNVFGKAQAETRLSVTGHAPPQIAGSASIVRVLEGQPVSLPCVILAGRPLPERRWLKATHPLPAGGRGSVRADGSLHFDRALQEDSGTYSCMVSNVAGSQHRDVELVVQVPPRIHPIATHHVTNEGVPASLPCAASGVPTPTITWTKESKALASGGPHYNVSKGGTLVITRPSPQDMGAYVCTATNAVGFSSQEMRLSVNTKPRIRVNGLQDTDSPLHVTAKTGKEVTLDCEAQGSPPPLVTWTKDAQPLLPGTDSHVLLPSGSLRLTRAQASDDGHYECTASNPAGSASRRYILGVQVPPQVQPGPHVLKALLGEALDLNCVAQGRPEPQLLWSKDGAALPRAGPAGSVHFEAVQISDAGMYRCEATSSAGTDAWELELRVLEPPHWLANNSSLVERVAGENASLPCPARGTPMPQVTWRKGPSLEPLSGRPGVVVLDDGSLFLSLVSLTDGGDYECQATNEVGSVSRRTKLLVYVSPSIREDGRQGNVSAVAGQPLSLECDASGSPVPEILWLKDGQLIPEAGGHRLLNGARTLHFPRLGEADSGLYSCRAENQAGKAQRDFSLLVLVPPSMLGVGATQEVLGLAGADVELECRTSGVPTPQVEWTKDGQPVLPGDPRAQLQEDGQVLRITGSHPGDAGQYQCTAFSPAGQQAKDFQLRVHSPPTIWGSNETGEVAAMEGHAVRLLCEARGTPAPDVTWFKDGVLLPTSPEVVYTRGGRQLQLSRAQSSDAGVYTCKASNPVGVTEKATRLAVYVAPTIEGASGGPYMVQAVAGRPLALECAARGFPPPAVSWQHEGLPLAESNGTWLEPDGALRLQSPGEASGGLYSCVASSPAGEAVLQYAVDVQVPPQLLVAEGSGQVAAIVGQPLELPCRASGSPAPTIQWLQNGRPAEELAGVRVASQGTTLHIDHVELAHAGLFACQATNDVGTTGAEVEVSVHELPSVDIIGSKNLTVPFLQSVTLQCVGVGMPPPSLHWWKDGVALATSGGTLQIEKVDLRDEGIYTCTATNLAGESKKDVAVKVLVPPNIEPGPINQAVLENTSITLECLASGVPPPDVSWFKGHQPVSARTGLTVSKDGRSLRIEQAQLSDAGSYRCVASNVAGSTELQYGLRVHVAPQITLAPSLPGPVLLGAPVRLSCNASGVPSPTLMWLKDGNPVSPAGTPGLQVFPGGRVLALASARTSDSGSYSCVAVSAVGEDRRDVTLQVHVPPSILGEELTISVMANESVTLECRSHAVPPPKLSWQKDSRPLKLRPGIHLSQDKALLEVSRAEVGDAGRYTCEALNRAGRSEKHFNVNVWVPPAFPLREPRPLAVTEGQLARLSCECRGVPFPKVTWSKDGQLLPGEAPGGEQVSVVGRLLYLGRARPAQEGTYTCECSNVAGNSSQAQRLEVHAPPQIAGPREPLTRVSVLQGGEAALDCNATGRPLPAVTWERDGQPLRTEPGLQLQSQGHRLRVQQAQAAHAGRYSCVAKNAVGLAERRFELSVLVPPVLLGSADPVTNVTAAVHGPLTLLCEATGVPPPEVRWFREEQPIQPREDTYLLAGGWMLRVSQAQEQDRGLYACLASNEAGEAWRNFSVEVLVPPTIENEGLEEVTRVPEGQTAQLTCNTTGHPQPIITWFKDGRPLGGGDAHHTSPDGAHLWVPQANLSHAGHYSCIASNVVGEKTKHFQLSVLVLPTILGATEDGAGEEVTVTINNPISLICEALAFPAPNITWMKDGVPFEASRNIQMLPGTRGLQILNAQKEDAGQYTCVVTNELGEATKSYHVEVLIPPSISKDDPAGDLGVKEVKTKVNSTLSLECECWGSPPPAISWYKDGQPVTPGQRLRIMGEGRLLQIQPTQVSDSGRYLCVATNVAGEDDQDFTVLIQVPPMFQRVGHPSAAFESLSREEEARGEVTEYREVVENNPAYLYCDTNAVPPPELTWYREGRPLSTSADHRASVLQGGRVLQLPLVRAEDAGRYSCKASNEVGEDWLHYDLLVLTPPVILGDTEELVEEVTVNASSTVSLQCPALGNPAPTLSWLQNGLPFSPSPRLQVLEDGRVLQVSTAEVADAASYMCVAENLAGSVEKLFTLRVQVPPRITGQNLERVSAVLNSSVSLPCEALAHPSPEVTWYKDDEALALGEEVFLLPGTHTLQLPRVQPSDSGTYLCEALNAAGRDQKAVQLSVLVPPTFRQAPDSHQEVIFVRAGDKAILNCETDSFPEPVVTWYKDQQPLAPGPWAQAPQDAQRLEILASQVWDKGSYSCKVSNAAGEATRTFVLTVQVPPMFENPKTETVSQVAGRALVLTCDVSGVPAPTVTWLKDRMPVESSVVHGVVSRGGRLQLSRLQPTQAGTYTCVAENAQAEARKDFVVAVLEAPRIRSSDAPQEHSVLQGQEVRLDCEVQGQPPPDVAWLKDGAPLQQDVGPHLRFFLDSSSLVLKGLRASDSGAYTCVARNTAGEDARLHTVTVLVPPTIEQEAGGTGILLSRPGELVTMACPVRGSPPIHVSWLKDGLPLPLSQRTQLHGSGRTLRISQVQLADAGTFTCVAVSLAGVASRNFTLQVLVPPILEPADFQGEVVVAPGSSVVLPCEAQGSPLPLLSWMKDGEPLLPQSLEQGPGLQLERVGAGDSGTYSCVATSEAGEAMRHFRLTVMDPPHIQDSGQPVERLLVAGAHMELLCDARGVPQPNITWHKDGQALRGQAGRVFRVEGVQVGDAGLYTCLAESPAGEAEKSFRVRVQAPPNVVGPQGPRSVVGLAPGQLVLECPVEAEPAPEIEWHRDGVLLQVDTHTQLPEHGRFLQLQALSTADSGHYSCTARNQAGSTSVAFHVEIHTLSFCPPHSGAHHPARTARRERLCEPDSPAALPGQWLEVLPDGSLRIQPVLTQDAGHYVCLASNSAGSDRQGRDLQVFEPPAISPGPSNLTLTAPSPAVLPCEASGSPKPLVAWWKDGQKLDFHTQQGAYRLLPSNALLLMAPSAQDSAQFECVVSNEVGQARKLYQVTVHEPPTIADDQTAFTVTRMAPVVLTCHSTGVPVPTVSWSKAGAQLGARGSGYRVSSSGALEIGQVLPIHAGRYTCTARNVAGVAHKHVVLTVQASPVVKPLPSVVQVVAEEEVLLPCEASGIPRPTVTWQKEGFSIPSGGRSQVLPSGQLRLTRAHPEDAGNYFCMAQNSAGSAMGRTRLVVQVPPVIESSLPDLSATEGSHALLPCVARGSPEPDIHWEKDGQPVSVSGAQGKYSLQPSGELLVKNSEGQDAGTYTCTAENVVGRARRRVHLTILALPIFTTLPGDRSLRLGDRLWLRCVARGSPTPSLSWTVNDLPVTEGVSEQDGGSTLQRAAVTRKDSGTYVCWAENRVGRVQAVSFVHVKEAPVLQGEPFSRLVEPVGGSIQLDCLVRGDPAPNIHWTKDGLPLWDSRLQIQNGSLTIHRTKMADAGQYQCLAENEVGAVKKVVTLVLQSAPVFQVEPQDVTVRPGEDVALRCRATGEPAPTIEWLRAGQPLRASRRLRTLPDGSLELERVEAGDAGEYQCVAHNLLGSATARAFLVLREQPRGSRGSMVGVINGQEFGMAALNTSVQQEALSGVTTIRSSVSPIPAGVGPLMRVLVVTVAPIYWALAGEREEALNGYSLTGGSFRQESHVEFATGELLRMTQVARGLDPDGLLLLDVVVSGTVPEALEGGDLQVQERKPLASCPHHSPVQDFEERYVQTGPGRLFVGTMQGFLHDNIPGLLRCNHSIQYAAARGPQPQLVQHLQASAVSSAFDPEAQALRFQLAAALQAEEHEAGCPEGFEPDPRGEFCVDRDECTDGPSPCSHSCHNVPGRFFCSCPAGFTLTWDDRTCRDVDECEWDTHLCQEGQRCVNLLGSYRCLPDCGPGFRVAAGGASCEDVDECLEQRDQCLYNQLCENTAGGHHCSCPRGYRTQGPGLPCLDVNECQQLPEPCGYQCHNLQGSYRCLCPAGYTLLRDGKACTPLERKGQNVTTVSHRRPSMPWLRPRAPIPGGSYHAWVSLRPGPGALSSVSRAWCPPGFIWQNGACVDLDECRVRSLCQHACQNTEGSYHCLCPAGYRLLPSGKNCQDINECEEDAVECGPGQMCFNTRGGFQCVDTPCPEAYRQGTNPGTCFRRCSQDCDAEGPATLQYRLLPLPLGVRAHHDVARLAAFSEPGVPANQTELRVLQPDPRSPFALRPLRAGLGAVYTRRTLTRAGLYRLTVRAAAPRHQSVYVLLIAVSPYPY